MSSDNVIIILETKDEFRIGHFQNGENLFYSGIEGVMKDTPVSLRVFEFFENCIPIIQREKAYNKAAELYEETGYVEYGLQKVIVDKTFYEIIEEAKEEVIKEIEVIREKNNNDWELEDLLETQIDIDKWIALRS